MAPDNDVIDGEGKTLLPGIIDTHMHIDNRDNCVISAKYGVTTLLDQMCNNTELIDSLEEPDLPIASVRSVYMPVQSKAGPLMVEALGVAPVFAATKEDVRRIIDEQIAYYGNAGGAGEQSEKNYAGAWRRFQYGC